MRSRPLMTLLFTSAILAACQRQATVAQPPEPLRVVVLSEPAGRLEATHADWNAAAAILTETTSLGLVRLNAAGEVEAGLARSWRVSDDGFSYIFRLDKRSWSDGRQVTARDIVALFRAALAPGSRHPFHRYLQVIENGVDVAAGRKSATTLGISAPMPDIVEIRLSSARPAFLHMLARPELALSSRDGGRISLGLYRVTRTEADLTLLTAMPAAEKAESDEAAKDGSRHPAGILLVAEADPATAIARFRRDGMDILVGGTTGTYAAARAAGLERMLKLDPVAGVYGYRVVRDDGPIADIRVRRALAMAIDRQEIIDGLGLAGLAPVTGVVPPSLNDIAVPATPDWDVLDPQARRTQAQALIAAYRGDSSRPLAITVALPASSGDQAVFERVRANWAAIGVNAEAVNADEPADLALFERVAPADLATWFLRPFECHRGSYCNPAVDNALSDTRVALSPVGRAAAMATADRLLVEDAAFIGLTTAARWSLVTPTLQGWTPNRWSAHPLGALSRDH